MAPADLSSLVIDGLNDALAPDVVVRASPSVDSIGRLGKVDAPARVCIDDEQTGFWVEAGGTVIREAALVGRNQASIGRRLLGGVWNGTTLLVDSQGPIHWAEGNGQETLSVGAIEHEEVAVARTLHKHLLRLAVEVGID